MQLEVLTTELSSGGLDPQLVKIYGAHPGDVSSARTRFAAVIEDYTSRFGQGDVSLLLPPAAPRWVVIIPTISMDGFSRVP